MKRFRTHYDNLKVSRNASAQEIKEAYKKLCSKHHPDRNQGNPDASRITAILNSSYEVLSDPTQRKLHDEWITQKETHQKLNSYKHPFRSHDQINFKSHHDNQIVNVLKTKINWNLTLYAKYLSFMGVGIFVWLSYISNKDIDPFIGSNSYIALPKNSSFMNVATAEVVYEKSSLAPNGKAWPSKANYLVGYEKLNTSGKSLITVDNTKNDSDVHVKLVLIDSEIAFPVRQFYIPAHKKFKVENITAGFYEIRHRDLNTNRLSKSEPFFMEEVETEGKVVFNDLNITLPKALHDNFQRYELAEAEF